METKQTPVNPEHYEMGTIGGIPVVNIIPSKDWPGVYEVRFAEPFEPTSSRWSDDVWYYDADGTFRTSPLEDSLPPDHPANLNGPIERGGRVEGKSPVCTFIDELVDGVAEEADKGVSLPTDPQERKECPIYSGVLKYFPDAVAAVANCSFVGNEQHHPGTPLHWDKSKSTDEHDAMIRHALEAGTIDTDGVRHSAKVAWRALAALQREIDAEKSGT